MGESQNTLFEPEFNRAVKVQTSAQRITSHAGAVLLREADHRLGLIESLAAAIDDPREEAKVRYLAVELLRERIYSMALGDSVQDDADTLAHDPALRMAVWNRPGEAGLEERLASQPTQSRVLDWLSSSANRGALRNALADWTHRHLRSTGRARGRRVLRATIDVDSFPLTVHGRQHGAAYNGHYRETIYHPQVASFSVEGDYDSGRFGHRLGNGFIHATLRQGQVHTAHGARRFLKHVIKHGRRMARSFDVRLDAGLANGGVMDELTRESVRFCGRLKKNPVLERLAEGHLSRPPGRPPAGGYETVVELGSYQAEGWEYAQRLILVVVDRPDPKTGQLHLLPRYFFLVTNWPKSRRSGETILNHYRKRGTFEDRLGEFNAVVGPHLSSPGFEHNEAALLLALLAFNLTGMLRNELEQELGGCWDLGRFQRTVLRAGGRVVKHSRRAWLHIEQALGPHWSVLTRCLARLRLDALWPAPRGPRPRTWIPPPPHAHLTLMLRD